MLRLEWAPLAHENLLAIVAYIAQDNPDAADKLADEIEHKAAQLPKHSKLYKPGRMKGTREIVVRPNYVMVYRIDENAGVIRILRVLHAAQQWP